MTNPTEIEAEGPAPMVEWRRLHALGWPAGSVRALLAILVFGTRSGLAGAPTNPGGSRLPPRPPFSSSWAHYFASRHRASQVSEPGPGPLFLPNGSVRVLLIAGTLAVGGLLYSRGQLTAPGQQPGSGDALADRRLHAGCGSQCRVGVDSRTRSSVPSDRRGCSGAPLDGRGAGSGRPGLEPALSRRSSRAD